MDNPTPNLHQKPNPTPNTQPPTVAKPNVLGKSIAVAAIIILAGTSGYALWRNYEISRQNRELQAEIDQLKAGEQTESETETETEAPEETPAQDNQQPTPTNTYRPSANLIENIKAALDTMNTQPIEGYMANNPVLYYANDGKVSEPHTSESPTAATLALDYFLDAKTPWNLNPTAQEIATFKQKINLDAKYFGESCIIGRSANKKHLVSLYFNNNGKIEAIIMSRTADQF